MFRGFRAKINVASKRFKDESVPVVCTSGVYRTNREEFFENGSSRITQSPQKITPSMVNLPLKNNLPAPIKPSKSTNDVSQPGFVPITLSKSTPEISFDPRGGKQNAPEVVLLRPEKSRKEWKKEEKEKAILEKKRQAEQKAREKAAQQQAKQENAKREKEAKQAKARDKKAKNNKTVAPQPPPAPQAPPPPQVPTPPQSAQPPTSAAVTTPIRQNRQPLAPSNSMKSDINRSSGPPPYSELPPEMNNKKPGQPANLERPNTSNVSFGKPIDNTVSSWDMVTQHRQQMSRPTATVGGARKQMVMDLQYNFNNKSNDDKDNSEA